jgi:hypothetical protein
MMASWTEAIGNDFRLCLRSGPRLETRKARQGRRLGITFISVIQSSLPQLPLDWNFLSARFRTYRRLSVTGSYGNSHLGSGRHSSGRDRLAMLALG